MQAKKYYILDADNKTPKPVNILDWTYWMLKAKRVVAKYDHDDVLVSTIFTGKLELSKQGTPYFFETLIFTDTETGTAQRYSTWQDAENGHRDIVRSIRVNTKANNLRKKRHV
ncbi:hypothetical protein ACO0LM_12385 [Undibacterium sp. Di26W]|uniref:hypothetical protein n=1 Tax=Undibacterium sp. Di26W TaxID=3413035 RepID=UPI003BF39913